MPKKTPKNNYINVNMNVDSLTSWYRISQDGLTYLKINYTNLSVFKMKMVCMCDFGGGRFQSIWIWYTPFGSYTLDKNIYSNIKIVHL